MSLQVAPVNVIDSDPAVGDGLKIVPAFVRLIAIIC